MCAWAVLFGRLFVTTQVAAESLSLVIDGLELPVCDEHIQRLREFLHVCTSDGDGTWQAVCRVDETMAALAATTGAEAASPDGPAGMRQKKAISARFLVVAVYKQAVRDAPYDYYARTAVWMGRISGALVLASALLDGGRAMSGAGAADYTNSSSSNSSHSVVHDAMQQLGSHGVIYYQHRLIVAFLCWKHLTILWMFFFVASVDYDRKDRAMGLLGTMVTPTVTVHPQSQGGISS
jgi:hypothetical protein